MSLQRSATRKAPGPAKEKKDYSIVEQAMKELYPLDKANHAPEIDIVLVPGLNAHPEESWKSESTKFNWTTEALVKDFPKSRVLLYKYQSAWTGPLKVKQFMANIAMGMLISLQSVRKKCQRRPIVFIGHSMGGLVVAKAIILADQRRDKFPIMFEAIAAAIFFGTPFGGAPVASVAAMYAYAAEKIGKTTSSKLLDLMKEGDEGLRELKHEFMRLAGKLSPKIELFCFYEEQPTDFSKMAGLPMLYGLSKLIIPKQYAEFVSRDSATLTGVDELGLACDHRDLVKFHGHKDTRWSQFVRDPLKKIIHGVQLAVKNRLNSVRDIDRTMINKIMESLEGAQVQKKRNALRQTFAPSSWITKEAEYIQWLAEGQKDSEGSREHEEEQILTGDCLWIRGPEGRGKTSASMAAVEEIETLIRTNEEEDTGQDPVLLAYFFCDTVQDYNTAEDVLKSLIRQLINQQETLAPYAKLFVKKQANEGGKSQAQVTVENMWQTLQDMLTDEFIGSKVIFILNNLHCLPEDSESTIKLMKFLNAELQNMKIEDTKRVPTRWLITSREAHNVEKALKVDGVRLVDLEDRKYGDQVQNALRKHAKQKVSLLEQAKKYNKALAYYASSLIGKRAQNTQWIDITCVQLEELPQTHSDLPVRRALETMPQDLTTLLNNSWLQVFKSNEQESDKIKEMLRALVLTYEDPTEAELGVLAGLCSNEEEKAELHGLVERCKPLLSIKKDDTISFMNVVVKTHLLENAKELLGLKKEEIKWQHGVLCLRAFTHLKERYDSEPEPTPEQPAEPEAANEPTDQATGGENDAVNGDQNAAASGGENVAEDQDEDGVEEDGEGEGNIDDDDDDEEEDEEEEEEDEYSEDEEEEDDSEGEEVEETKFLALPYMVKYWLRHASKATLEIAEDLSLETDFWKHDSHIRRRWLEEYCELTSTFEYYDPTTLTGLHVAASVGYRQLVAALIRNYEPAKAEIKVRDSLHNSPLHFAANFGRPNIVEELLNRGAPIDDGDREGAMTPLHMAACDGRVEVMKKLLLRDANPNATAKDVGPVVNSAISSGNRAAVELLVDHGVSLTVNSTDIVSPLALAALLSDVSMFEYLIQKYADKLPAVEYSKALVKAAEAGRVEVFNKLLEFQHDQVFYQDALDAAVEEWNWDITTILLQRRPGLDCNKLFYTAATCSEPQDKILEVSWEYTNGSITAQTLNDSLYHATDREKDTTVQLLLEKFRADPNATGEDFGNALTAAAYDGTLHIVKMLLDAGADINAPEGYPIQAAAAEGHYDVVQELLKQPGANVNALTTRDSFAAGTALQGATEAGQTEIVRLLLNSGANPNHGAGEDAPPIIAAAMRAEEEILELLVKAKPKLDVFGGWDMSSPLINAAAYMPVSSLKLLLDAGADVNLADNDGDTALIVASGRGDEEAVEFLLNNGADIMHSSKRSENALQSALEAQNLDCLKVLVDHVSVLFGALKKSMDSGNPAVTSVVRSAASTNQGLNYDDDRQATTQQVKQNNQGLNYDDEPRTTTQQVDLMEAHANTNTPATRDVSQYNNVNGYNGHIYEAPGDRAFNGSNGISQDQEAEQNERVSPAFSALRDNRQNDIIEDSRAAGRGNLEGYPVEPQYYASSNIERTLEEGASYDNEYEGPAENMGYSESQAVTDFPDDDGATEVASTINEDMNEEDETSAAQDGDDDIPDAITQLSDELQSALGNQVSLFNQFDRSEQAEAPSDTDGPMNAPRENHEQHSRQESPVAMPSQPTPAPVELPTQGFIRRKPAPLTSYEHISRQSQTPSPKTVDTSYQAQPTNDDYDLTTPTAAYHPVQEGAQYHQQQNFQAAASSSSAQPQPSAPYQGTYRQSYQPAQASQTATTGYPQQQQAQHYQTPSLYDGSQFGNPETTHYPPPGQKQTYAAYHPDLYQQHPQQQHSQQQQNVYSAEQASAYHNHQAYDQKYQNYYASLQTAQQQQQPLNRQDSWDAERPSLKPQRSSFFTGGVKNTLGKAKIVGNGFLSRK